MGSESNIIEAHVVAPYIRCVKVAEPPGSDLTEIMKKRNGVGIMRIEKVNLLVQLVGMTAGCCIEDPIRAAVELTAPECTWVDVTPYDSVCKGAWSS